MNYYVSLINKYRKKLTYKPGFPLTVSDFRESAEKYTVLVRVYYCVLCFLFYQGANNFVEMGDIAPTDPLWPMELLWPWLIHENGIFLASLFLPAALLCILFPGSLILRSIAFLGILVLSSYQNSFGTMNHNFHFMLYIAFGFLLLPNLSYSRVNFNKKQVMQIHYVFWGCSFILLFAYSMSGVWKILGFGTELIQHDTLTLKALNRSIEIDGRYILWQGLAASYPSFFQAMHIITVFVQVTSLVVFLRPHFYKAYGGILIFFHFGTLYLLGIAFVYHVFIWALFFILTPMAPKHSNFVLMIHSIPIFGTLFQKIFPVSLSMKNETDSETTIIYDGDCPFCSNYVAYMKLKSAIGPISLIDARVSNHPLIEEVKRRDINLNDGMVFVYNQQFYYGSDAIYMITQLSKIDGFFSTFNHFLFSNPTIARICYPVYKLGRRITLKILGRKKLDY